MDKMEENDKGKRDLVEGGPVSLSKKTRKIAMIVRPKTDLTLLKKLRASLNNEDLEAFRARFGRIDDILDIEVDWQAITAILQFYVPELRCFVFPNFDLTPTIDEYLYMLALPEGVSPSKVFIPDLNRPPSNWVNSAMSKLCGVDQGLTKRCLSKVREGDKTISFRLNWNDVYQELDENWRTLKKKQEQRINFLAVGIYGLVLLPTKNDQVDSEVICLIEQLIEQPGMNVAPAILAETFSTLGFLKNRKTGTMMCCSQLLTMWLHGHFPVENPFYGCCRIPSARPAARFCKIPKKIMTAGDWYKMLYSAKPGDVNWRVGWLCVKEYIAPPKNRTWIPLIGIKWMTSYTPNLVMRQLSNIQEVPNLKDISDPDMRYSQHLEVIQLKLTLMDEEWKDCEIKKAEMKLGTTSEYISWRQTWMKDRVIPHPSEIYQPGAITLALAGFECQIRQLKQERRITNERNIHINNDPKADVCLLTKILEKLKEDQRKLLELEEEFHKSFPQEPQGELRQEHKGESRQVSLEHQGDLGQEQKGESRQDSQKHQGDLGQEKKRESRQEHEGESRKEHEEELIHKIEIANRLRLTYIMRLKSVEEEIEELRQGMELKIEDLEKRIRESTVSGKRLKIGS